MRIEKAAFWRTAMKRIHVPVSVEMNCETCFAECEMEGIVNFDGWSRQHGIEELGFASTVVTAMTIPGGITFISPLAFDAESVRRR
jgi:hypothetical protein